VVGVGVGLRRVRGEISGEVAVVVMVTHKVPRSQLSSSDCIPAELDNVPVDVQVTGELKAW
jgi:hypothetical protein